MLFWKHCIVLYAIMHCMYQYILLAMNSPCMLICQRCQKTAPKMPILIGTVRNYAPHWHLHLVLLWSQGQFLIKLNMWRFFQPQQETEEDKGNL